MDSGTLDTVLTVARLLTLVVLIVTYVVKWRTMRRYTHTPDRLTRAVEAETTLYIALWMWILLRPLIPYADAAPVVLMVELALVVVTLRVVSALPHAGWWRRQTDDERRME